MSDTGFGNILSPARPAAQHGGVGVGLIVKIINLPPSLGNPAKALRLAGEVTQQNQNGTLRISTDKGEIEVQVKGNKTPQKGQKLEIEIPTGRPPRQATLRDAVQQRTQTAQNQDSSNRGRGRVTTQQVQTTPSQPRQQPSPSVAIQSNAPDKSRPISPRVFQPLLQDAKSPLPNQQAAIQTRPLTTEATVRLISASPAQAQAIATEYVQTLPAPQVSTALRAAFTANLIVQNIQNQQASLILQTPSPQTGLTVQTDSGVPTPINKGFSPIQIGQTLILIPPTTGTANTGQTAFLSQLQNTQTIPAPNAHNVLQATPTSNGIPNTAQHATQTASNATLTPLTFDPANPTALSASRANQIDIQVLKIIPPLATLTPTGNTAQSAPHPAATQFISAITSANNAATVTAQVTGFTTQGLPLVTVKWPGSALPQSFTLQFKSNNLQLGSQLQIIPKGMAVTASTMASTSIMATTGTQALSITNPLLMGFQWPALDALYNGLLHVSPQAAASLTRALPNAASAAQIGPAAMMFIAAVRSGDIANWLGDKKIDLLQRSNASDILKRLSQDSSSTGRAAPTTETTQTSEWRAVPLPMFWEGEIHKITLFSRHENQQNQEEENENTQTRFVFDLSLSRMGDIQLDGLLRDKRLDLVIRAQNTFSEHMQQTMRKAYTGALSSTELTGDLNFQGSTKNWVHVLQEKEQLGVHV